VELTGDFPNDLIQHSASTLQILPADRQQISCLQSLEEFELDLVNKRSALQRIELIDRLRNFAWGKPVDGLKEKPIRTSCIILQRGRRVAEHAQTMLCNCRLRCGRWLDEAIGRSPLRTPFLPAGSQRAAQIGIRREQISCCSLGLTWVGVEETPQYREVVFGVIDRLSRIVRGRPAYPSGAFGFGSTFKFSKVREPPLRRAYRFQGVK